MFIGCEDELKFLNKRYESDKAEFLVKSVMIGAERG